jgi:5'-methylthioadenosine phosphorylase
MPKIGIIGGSGIQSLFESSEEVKISTPYGQPSGTIEIGKIRNIEVAFLPRHGKGHIIPPHKINSRANIWALNELGVHRIISPSTVGSLKENYKPSELVVLDQYIDFTKNREYTFYDGGKTIHISMADPFCPQLRELFIENTEKLSIPVHSTGTYICIEGPRFSTRSESRMFKLFGDIVGMTLVPEVQLARELEICYVNLAMVTDYDVWAEKPVSAEEILTTMKRNIENIRKLIEITIPCIPDERNCECSSALKSAGV